MTFNPFGKALALASLSLIPIQAAFANENPATGGSDARAPDPVLTDTIVVSAVRPDTAEQLSQDSLAMPEQIALPADATAIAARVPGGAFFGNGALSGQLSYRGLAGQRVLGRVNGQRFATGGPNAMDPPFHYAPSVLVERIDVARGVAPVSQGPSLAGAVNAQLFETDFGDGASLSPDLRFTSQYRSVDNSYAVGFMAGVSNENWRFGVIASREEGDDYEFPGGTAVGTSFERNLYGAHAGFQTGAGELFIEYRRSETDPTGNPPSFLDIVFFDTDFVQGGFRGEIADDVQLSLRLGHVSIAHLMDNQTTRNPVAPPTRARATFADADTSTAELAVRFGEENSYVEIGADTELTDKFVTITNPFNDAFFLESQPNGAAALAACSLNLAPGSIAPASLPVLPSSERRFRWGRAGLPRPSPPQIAASGKRRSTRCCAAGSRLETSSRASHWRARSAWPAFWSDWDGCRQRPALVWQMAISMSVICALNRRLRGLQNSASTLKPMFSPCVQQPFTAALMTLFRVSRLTILSA